VNRPDDLIARARRWCTENRRVLYLAVWPVALMLTILWSSGTGGPQVPRAWVFPNFDKVGHFFVFGLIATLIYRCVRDRPGRAKAIVFAIALTSLFGALDELRQSFNPHRHADLEDWFVDTMGAVIAVLSYEAWTRYRKLLEWPVWGRSAEDLTVGKDCCPRK